MRRLVSTYSEITYEVADNVATITLSRPDRLNAFTTTMCREMVAAFDAADADDQVRVVLLTGAGRGFCAGADLGRGGGTPARRGGRHEPAAPPPPKAGDRRGERARGRCGCHDDLARRRADRGGIGAVRVRVRAPRHRPRGRVELVPAAGGRDLAGHGVGSHRAGVRRGRGEGR